MRVVIQRTLGLPILQLNELRGHLSHFYLGFPHADDAC